MTVQRQDWDIVSSVGVTALAVAALRALESTREDALVHDPYAAAFIEAANAPVPMPTRFDQIPAGDRYWAPASPILGGVRSKFFDDFFAEATAAGVRQVVILASGLDCRAFRLDWPAGTTVFELDQPRVLEFKDRVLAELGARPACDRREIPIDLREDWAASLRQAGFDPGRPTAWLAEGLLMYLPAEAAIGLLETIHQLSAPGSRVAVENYSKSSEAEESIKSATQAMGVDYGPLLSERLPKPPDEYLSDFGWRTSSVGGFELAERYGRARTEIMPELGENVTLIAGTLGE